MRRLVVYCDGSFRPPAQGGVGVVIASEDGMPIRRFGEPLQHPVRSANEAEYWALLRGLEEALKMGATAVEVFVDSTLVHGQLTQGWACNHEHLRRLRDEVRTLLQQFTSWQLLRVESRFNPIAHTLANTACDRNRRRFWSKRFTYSNTQHTQEGGNDTMKLVVSAQALTLPDDVYVATLVDVQQQTGAYGEQLVWRLRVAEGEFAGTELRAWTNASTAVNSKAIRWASAFAGEAFTAGDVVDLDALKGKRARAIVQSKQTADGRTYARVTDLLPAKQRATVPADDGDPFLED